MTVNDAYLKSLGKIIFFVLYTFVWSGEKFSLRQLYEFIVNSLAIICSDVTLLRVTPKHVPTCLL